MRTINQYVIEKKLKINLNLTSITINGGQHRLRVRWTPEMAQDISIFHNIDVEAELTRVLREEINRSILNDLMDNNFLHQ